MRKSAVEKAGAWKPSKTTNRFPPAPTLPWKSRRKREIPTFPPRRLRLLLGPKEKQRQNQKPRRRRPEGRVALFHKADRSRINKTGHLDLLTTPPPRPSDLVATCALRLRLATQSMMLQNCDHIRDRHRCAQ